MLSKEMNDRLTRVGPGTPMGNLLRRYWHPIGRTPELDEEPVLAITLLGENLALFRSDDGSLGIVSQRCPHPGASLAYGIPEEDGLRCPYHGRSNIAGGRSNITGGRSNITTAAPTPATATPAPAKPTAAAAPTTAATTALVEPAER